MQGIIGATLCALAFWGLYKFFRAEPFGPERIKDWGRAEGTITKIYYDHGSRKYYVSFSDEHGEHLGKSTSYSGEKAKAIREGDKVDIRYNLHNCVDGMGVDAFVLIEGIKEKKPQSKFDIWLLCTIGFVILDIYLIIQEVLKWIAQ